MTVNQMVSPREILDLELRQLGRAFPHFCENLAQVERQHFWFEDPAEAFLDPAHLHSPLRRPQWSVYAMHVDIARWTLFGFSRMGRWRARVVVHSKLCAFGARLNKHTHFPRVSSDHTRAHRQSWWHWTLDANGHERLAVPLVSPLSRTPRRPSWPLGRLRVAPLLQ